jgi:hypothetical protein
MIVIPHEFKMSDSSNQSQWTLNDKCSQIEHLLQKFVYIIHTLYISSLLHTDYHEVYLGDVSHVDVVVVDAVVHGGCYF